MKNACRYAVVMVALFLFGTSAIAQQDSLLTLEFTFNRHNYNEENNRVHTKPVGVSLVRDRFGNERSAVYTHGHINSYLNLGTSPLLKAKTITISMWVKLTRRVYAGKGYDHNPGLIIKNYPGNDFYTAYGIGYDCYSKSFVGGSSRDSLKEALIIASEEARFNEWYHLVLTSDYHHLAFYVNGVSQGNITKEFETMFLSTDSMVIGHSANKKNERFSQGTFDDIRIFHRVLSEQEVFNLYHEPNPNRTKALLMTLLKYTGILAGIFVIAFLLVWQRRRALKREQEKFALNNRLYEMEIRTLKAQMNPHFIFNSLNSIQQFIMGKDNDKAELYLSKFSKLLRKLLESNANESLSVLDEVEMLNRYLEMEALRFSHSFVYTVEVDASIDQARTMIPHLLIQPFIENAIWHGLLHKRGERQLTVHFSQDDPRTVTCIVDDNGIGRVASSQIEETFRKKSLALSFVTQRLELLRKLSGTPCRVEITDKMNTAGESTGTRVKVVLPVLETKDHDTSNSH